MIVKCQHSITTTCAAPQMLIYDKARKWQWSGDVTPEWAELFKRFGPRFFANCKVFKDGRPPEFVRKVIDLDWPAGVTVTDNRRDGGTLATVPFGLNQDGVAK